MKKKDIKNLILKHKKTIVIVVISALAIGGGVTFVKGRAKINNKNIFLESSQDTVKLTKGDFNESVVVKGIVKSGQVSNVSSKIAAKVKSVNVKVGDLVKAGDVICILDDSDIVKEIENKKKAIDKEKIALQENYDKLVNQLNTLKSTESQNIQSQNQIVEAAKNKFNNANSDLSSYEGTFNGVKNSYNSVLNGISNSQNNYSSAQNMKKQCYEAWVKSGSNTDSQEYKNYMEASNNFDKRREELEEAKSVYDYDNTVAKYNEALSIYNEKSAARDTAKLQYDEAVVSSNTASGGNKSELETLQASITEASNQIQKLNNNEELKELEERLNNTVLKAETSGKITELKVNVGSMTDGAIATIQSTDNLILSVNIPEYDIQKVSVGMKTLISSDTVTNKIEGELVRISPVASNEENSNGFAAEIIIKDAQGMFIGTKAKAEIVISSKKDVILAPIDSIKNINGNASVFVKEIDESFKEVPVTVGGKNDYYVEITGSDIREGVEIKSMIDEEKTDISDTTSDLPSEGGSN